MNTNENAEMIARMRRLAGRPGITVILSADGWTVRADEDSE